MNSARSPGLALPASTYQRRLRDLQAALRGNRLAGVLLFDPENIFWLSGYRSTEHFGPQYLFVPERGETVLITRADNPFAAPAIPAHGQGRLLAIADTDEPTDVLAHFLDGTLPPGAALGVETATRHLSVRDFTRLGSRLPHVQLSEWPAYIEERRVRKSPEEIERIRGAARAAEAGLDAALATLAPGKTENEIAAAMYAAGIRAGSHYPAHPPRVVSGARTALRFATWRRRPVRTGDVVVLEAGGCIDHYHAMIARTAVIRTPTPLQKRAANALTEAVDAVVTAIAPGRTSGEVDAASRRVVEEAGLGHALVHETGCSVGIGFAPDGCEGRALSIRPDDATVLEAGMTFHIAPTLLLEDFGVRVSETVLVTDDGCDVLTDYLRRLFVVDT